jgi:hypothetical protein
LVTYTIEPGTGFCRFFATESWDFESLPFMEMIQNGQCGYYTMIWLLNSEQVLKAHSKPAIKMAILEELSSGSSALCLPLWYGSFTIPPSTYKQYLATV